MFDVVVVGGGPAGMMAAGRAAECGAKVLLVEKNSRLGVKLLITGHGRCNLTNNIPSAEFIKKIGPKGEFLKYSMHHFGPSQVFDFFESRKLKLKTENFNRVFPESDKSSDVLFTLEKYLARSGVEVICGRQVKRFLRSDDLISSIELDDGSKISAKNFIFATGGKSYPVLGATGDGFTWAKKLGHTVSKLYPALTPIIVSGEAVKKMEGISLQQIELRLRVGNVVIAKAFGDGIVTANGLSGPVAHDLSKYLALPLEENKNAEIEIDFLPTQNVDEQLRSEFEKNGRLMLKTIVGKYVSPKLLNVIIENSGLDSEIHVSGISKNNRKKLAKLLNSFSLKVERVMGFEKANITFGGVSLLEVDSRTMKSKLINNLFFAGEVLDLDGPTGGFNLQICWSTGYLAGESSTK
ncbi:MAG: NAD(P)/FAD-dependent oxidoreductase [bacterium]